MKLKPLATAGVLAGLACAALPSCTDNGDKDFSQLTLGTIEVKEGQDYGFVLDAGGRMYPGDTTQIHGYAVNHGQRTFIYFDLLDERVPGYEYNAIIYRIENILTKDIVRMPADISEEEAGADHINVTNAWLTADHLNIQYQLLYNDQSDRKHLLTLALAEPHPADAEAHRYVNLEFRHNAYGEEERKPGAGLVSFRLENVRGLMQGKRGFNIRYHSLYEGIRHKKVEFN